MNHLLKIRTTRENYPNVIMSNEKIKDCKGIDDLSLRIQASKSEEMHNDYNHCSFEDSPNYAFNCNYRCKLGAKKIELNLN